MLRNGSPEPPRPPTQNKTPKANNGITLDNRSKTQKDTQKSVASTCGVFPGDGAVRVLKVRHHLVADVQVVVPRLVHQVAAGQVAFDQIILGHCAGQEVHREQREAQLETKTPLGRSCVSTTTASHKMTQT